MALAISQRSTAIESSRLTISELQNSPATDGYPELVSRSGAPTGIPKSNSRIVKCEHRTGHRPFGSYQLPKWVKHPDAQKPGMLLQPEDYMGSKKRHNIHNWNVAHIGAQCAMFEGQGFKMLQKATPEEINAQDSLEGFTPLHWAVLSDNPKAVIWLLKHGADSSIQDRQGRTAEDLVEDHWGDFYQRYWGHCPKNDGLPQVEKVLPKRLKQIKDAFKLNFTANEYDIEGYKAIEV
eukprot:TRINITY_DN22616_c1_g1_i1.p1 TRINITY_DN22616_c1_g1~~TRINITY_DN22616_c1_g1_i1.p1  ORF type:complete len:257 (+),score=54.61 TRINITY_DN22616_c1_g1_i1:64-771(+)